MADFSDELVITEFDDLRATADPDEDDRAREANEYYRAREAEADAYAEAFDEVPEPWREAREEAIERGGDEEADQRTLDREAERGEVEVEVERQEPPTTVASMLAALRGMYWGIREEYRDNVSAADGVFQEMPDVPELAEAREDYLFGIARLEEQMDMVARWLSEVSAEAPADRTQLYTRADRDILCNEFGELCNEASSEMSHWLDRIENEVREAMLEYKAELERREWKKDQRLAAEFAREHYESFRRDFPNLLTAGRGQDLERLLGHVQIMHQLVETFAL